ncbi:DUF1269 domain-containing protein [Haloarcula marina]|uniref:DUF1269 domain-containing protein n=1 Tax=Haloarcula marina TaxID=2961574 RepID=UPI0020B79115|nr:DUF1269 domain-containing protein [Halomicroarcula marina]
MSELIVLSFDSQDGAKNVRDRLYELRKEELITLADACVVSRNKKGRLKFKQARNLVGEGAMGGMFWGALVGLLFLNPLAGAAVGSVIGGLTGKFGDIGVDDSFLKEVSESLGEEESALFMLVDEWSEERVLEELKAHNPEVLRTNLSPEDEDNLRAAFGGE